MSEPPARGAGSGAADGGAPDATAVERVRAALREVVDPEVGINVVDLGLVYGIDVRDGDVRVAMTMTSPVCPLNEYITTNAEAAVRRAVPGVRAVRIDLVWDPPWRPDMMSDVARRALRGSR